MIKRNETLCKYQPFFHGTLCKKSQKNVHGNPNFYAVSSTEQTLKDAKIYQMKWGIDETQ